MDEARHSGPRAGAGCPSTACLWRSRTSSTPSTCRRPTARPFTVTTSPPQDSAVVAMIREKGGVILGKTDHARNSPPSIRPRPATPTTCHARPAGSSAGSRGSRPPPMMSPIAVGSQTTGSVIRPAAYCGVVGYKPSFHAINVGGMKPLAPSMDTVGILSRTVEDAMLLAATLWDTGPIDLDDAVRTAPRIAFCRTPQWDRAERLHAGRDRRGGFTSVPRGGDRLKRSLCRRNSTPSRMPWTPLVGFEMWRTLTFERRTYPGLLSPRLKELLAMGEARTGEDYRAALALAGICRAQFAEMMRGHDVIMTLSATGEAPLREESTGDPTFCKIWTVMYGASVTVPAAHGPNGLPLGIQVAAPYANDDKALVAAEWIRRTLGVGR